jgi:hypothetical protein
MDKNRKQNGPEWEYFRPFSTLTITKTEAQQHYHCLNLHPKSSSKAPTQNVHPRRSTKLPTTRQQIASENIGRRY